MVSSEPRHSEPATNVAPSVVPIHAFAVRHVAPDMAELAPLRSWLDDRLASKLTTEQLQLFRVAVTEAVTNAIEAHRRAGIEQPVRVTVDVDAAMVAVEDHGGGIELEEAEPRSAPAPSAPRGRGLLIIRSICPEARLIDLGPGVRVELPCPVEP